MSSGVSFTENTENFDALVKDHQILKNIEVLIGILGEKASKSHKDSSLSNVQIGEIHEFGAPNAGIPERSFLRQAMDSNPDEVLGRLINAYSKVSQGKDPKKEMRLVGEFCRGLVLEQFKKSGDPAWEPLDEKTIKARKKGSKSNLPDKPLIDTGQLRSSIQSDIRTRGFFKE